MFEKLTNINFYYKTTSTRYYFEIIKIIRKMKEHLKYEKTLK